VIVSMMMSPGPACAAPVDGSAAIVRRQATAAAIGTAKRVMERLSASDSAADGSRGRSPQASPPVEPAFIVRRLLSCAGYLNDVIGGVRLTGRCDRQPQSAPA